MIPSNIQKPLVFMLAILIGIAILPTAISLGLGAATEDVNNCLAPGIPALVGGALLLAAASVAILGIRMMREQA